MPKVSVIVPVYNTEQYLPRCIDSILAQTFTDFELILVNDGSTDSSGMICNEYAKKDSRIKVFHQGNRGVSSARNKGIDIAKGEWISFVDSDDEYYNDNSLLYLYSQITNNIELVIGGYVCCDKDGIISYNISDRVEKEVSAINGIKLYYNPEYYKYLGYTCIKLYNRQFLLKNKLRFNEQLAYNEDGLLHIQYCSLIKGNIKFFTFPIYKYYQMPTSAMGKLGQKFEPKFLSDFVAFLQMYDIIEPFKDHHLTKMAKNAIINSYNHIILMMHKFNAFDINIQKQLKQQMLLKIGKCFYFKYKISLLKCTCNTIIYNLIHK